MKSRRSRLVRKARSLSMREKSYWSCAVSSDFQLYTTCAPAMSGRSSNARCDFRLSESVKRKFCGAAAAGKARENRRARDTAPRSAGEKKRRARARRFSRADPKIGNLLLRDRATEHPVDLLVGGIAAGLRSLSSGQRLVGSALRTARGRRS